MSDIDELKVMMKLMLEWMMMRTTRNLEAHMQPRFSGDFDLWPGAWLGEAKKVHGDDTSIKRKLKEVFGEDATL